jgi:DNA mismatch repair protein MutH
LSREHDGKFKIDLEEYMEVKNLCTIEKIKNIVGEIMQSCRG